MSDVIDLEVIMREHGLSPLKEEFKYSCLSMMREAIMQALTLAAERATLKYPLRENEVNKASIMEVMNSIK